MSDGWPLHRFEEFGPLTAAEVDDIKTLGTVPIAFERHQVVRPEGAAVDGFYILLEGWAAASITLHDGGRQILKLHLPGDVLGSPSMSGDHAVETLSALTRIIISPVPLTNFGHMINRHPRIGGYFLMSVQRERVALMDQLASMGRTTAEARLAALFVDLAERLAPLGLVVDDRYHLPLTQEDIADTLGLTAVHVNRMIRRLEERGWLAREKQWITLCDRAALVRVADRRSRPFRTDMRWLPASR